MPPSKKTVPTQPLVFGKKEKPNILKIVVSWLFVLFCCVAIYWMVASNPGQKQLVCHNPVRGSSSLIAFGTCDEE